MNNTRFNLLFYSIIIIILGVIIIQIGATVLEYTNKEEVTATVLYKEMKPITNNRMIIWQYIIVTNQETFIIDKCGINNKFDYERLYYMIEKDKTYKFDVCGYKHTLFEYRKIYDISY